MKKLLILIFAVVLLFSFPLSASAKYYTDNIPLYVNLSGGAYFEVYDSNLGQVTIVFPTEFKDCCFGFSLSNTGAPVNFVNVTNSTVNGTLYAANGKKYTCRAPRQDIIEYYVNDSSYNSYYVDLSPNMATLVNTNMQFLTSDNEWYNQSLFDNDKFVAFALLFLVLLQLVSLFILALRKGR